MTHDPRGPSDGRTRREFLRGAGGALTGSALAASPPLGASVALEPPVGPRAAAPPFELRVCVEQLRNPYWYAENGHPEEAKTFWDQEHWERVLRGWSQDEYNAILYWIEPWQQNGWQSFLIRHKEFPEARELTAEQSDRLIRHVDWIFRKGRDLGLRSFLFTYCIVTTRAFAKAHGMDKEMPVSASLDFRHNQKDMGPHFGVRNELTRAFTEATVAELFQTYPDLHGLMGGMGEALPGKRSSWFREAIAPGLKRSGRHPLFVVMNWMLPLEDLKREIAPKEVYDNTWTSVTSNVEMFTDAKPYPMAVRWAEESGLPTILEIVHHNHEAGFPFNSPRLAYEIVREFANVRNCAGFLAWFLRYDRNDLFRKALGYYGKNAEPYSDEPWVKLLEERFGDRNAAEHFLKAYDAAARIPGEVTAIALCPHDRGVSHQIVLPYWYWTEEDPRWSEFASPARAGLLLPVRYYARVVAKHGDQFRDNDGTDPARNREHPGSQEMMWGFGDYPTTPEAHMRNVRRLGEECLREAEEALTSVKKGGDEAAAISDYMKAYKLLSDYYERKVRAAVSALIYGFAGARNPAARAEAERLADEAVERYAMAADFIWERIDRKAGQIKGRWDGRTYTLPELIEREKKERERLPALFHWK